MTGIELSTDSCVIVDVRRREGSARLSALHVVEPPDWPPEDLSGVRRRKPFAPHAHVVRWDDDPATLAMLLDAGFIADTVVTPEEALAIVAAESGLPRKDGATAWIALSRHGAAFAIVNGADVLFTRRIPWRYKAVSRLRDQLLQRYSLVAHLAPELQHGIEVVRSQHGVSVSSAITCGDLPDLRSLTMPLIEEMDLEVETLDSLEGLDVTTSALADGAMEHAPALRLAAAVTSLPPARHHRRFRWWGRSAAAALLVVAAGWLAFSTNRMPPGRDDVAASPPSAPAPTATAGESAAEPRIVPLVPRAASPASAEVRDAPTEPLPAVGSILIGANRRLAILNGTIVGEGDAVGRRRVARIERDGVVLRDPSGGEIRVGVPRVKQGTQP